MRNTIRSLSATVCLIVCVSAAAAESFPARAVTIVFPFPPGGAAAIIPEIVTKNVEASIGQRIGITASRTEGR